MDVPQFVLPDINQPSCSKMTVWGRPGYRGNLRGLPSWHSSSSIHSLSPIETESSGVSTSEASEERSSPPISITEDEYEVREPTEEQKEWRRKVVPMCDEELDMVEDAHRKSRFMEIYAEPSLRFFAMPPPLLDFITPRVPLNPAIKDQRTAAVVPGFPATVASAASSPRNDNSLTATKTRPPTPPPTAPVDGKGNFEVSKMDVLSEQIWHYHNSITQTDSMLNRKLSLRDMLYYTISPVFPMCGLYVVGSSLNGFGNNTSDMDLCLMITNKDLDQRTDAVVVLNLILSTLAQLDWVDTQHLILAKVPILRIKFNAPFQDITVDLNANNSVAIRNTHLLCYYSSFDWRVRPLVSVVKEWAKKKGINDANRSSFTSYSLVLMVIHYLQSGADQVILPSLQAMYPKRFHHRVDVRTLNVSQKLPPVTEGWEYHEKASLGELFIGFLNYYANKFNFDHHAISVRQGRRVDRATIVGQNNSKGNWSYQWKCICIEEPFTLSNTAHSVYDEMVFGAIKGAFREAHAELEKNRDLHSLLECKPINVSLQHNGELPGPSCTTTTIPPFLHLRTWFQAVRAWPLRGADLRTAWAAMTATSLSLLTELVGKAPRPVAEAPQNPPTNSSLGGRRRPAKYLRRRRPRLFRVDLP